MPEYFTNENITEIVSLLLVSIASLLIAFILKQLRKTGMNVLDYLKQLLNKESGLLNYKQTLQNDVFNIKHPWMKESQKIEDILMPIGFTKRESNNKSELKEFIVKSYTSNPSLRFLILGKPGSGKTIAIRSIIKIILDRMSESFHIPILLTFNDLKGLSDNKSLESVLVNKLKYYQFEQGRKKSGSAQRYIDDNLNTGKIFLLFDGYDELDKSNRELASKLLCNFLGTHRNIPAIISSRTAVYENDLSFEKLIKDKIEIAPFTPLTVRKFISKWEFEINKSSYELFEIIREKSHLMGLASNPLLLTIISYLYSKPKYNLPNNRVEFYEECSRALLETFDRSSQVNRANKFEYHQKIAVLNRIAFEHISEKSTTDEMIDAELVYSTTKEEMNRLSLKSDEYPIMVKEIALNSGLIQKIAPEEFRFPHRTFLEFFAANYIVIEKTGKEMIELFQQDKQRWRETLILYLGINKNKLYTNEILRYLKDEFIDNPHIKSKPDTLVFSSLTECAVPDPNLAEDILNLAYNYLINYDVSPQILEELGYIAANQRWSHSKKAKHILLKLLGLNLTDNNFQYLLTALLRTRDESIDKIVIENLNRIDLIDLLGQYGSNSSFLINQLFCLKLSEETKNHIIVGLMEAANTEVLFSILVENNDEEIKKLSAFALLRLSGISGFLFSLDTVDVGSIHPSIEKELNAKITDWGWYKEAPNFDSGKIMCFLISFYSAKWIISNLTNIHNQSFIDANNTLLYLTNCFLVENGLPFHQFNLLNFNNNIFISLNGLLMHWRTMGKRRVKHLPKFIHISFLFPFFSVLGLIGFITLLLGRQPTFLYNSIFDDLTVIVMFCTSIFVLTINLVFSKWKWLSPLIYTIRDLMPSQTLLSHFVVATISLFSIIFCFIFPLHSIVYTLFYELIYFILLFLAIDDIQLYFAVINDNNITKLYNFISE